MSTPDTNTEIAFEKLPEVPNLLSMYGKAAVDQVPVVGTNRKADSMPTTGYEVSGVSVSAKELAEYTRVTGLRLDGHLPLTYPFILTFPVAMKLMTSKSFPFPAMGAVHLRNEITSNRELVVGEELFLRVWAENLREHPSGLLVDVVSEVYTEGEPDPAWRQVSSFLNKRRTSLTPPKDAPRPPKPEDPTAAEIGDPTTVLSVDSAKISTYAEVSGDRNPIHVSSVGAKAFGFPNTIAHGMWTAAALLASVEGRIPERSRYTVQFGKPVVLPAKVAVYARESIEEQVIDGVEPSVAGWTITARKPRKLGHVFATATIEEL
ncbi:MaoC family dehydratase [Dietzia sp.]|uniref:MaoC family dehydratase n=1 Tax=Dietzia sp. TaxID=1871616 RepID=UPI002FD9AD0E